MNFNLNKLNIINNNFSPAPIANVNNKKKSTGITDLTNYKLITRDNIDELEIGSHIKYIKNVFDINTNKIYEKIYNGGFLIDIIDGNIMHNLTLILKTNIIWKMRFINYKVYIKTKDHFNYNFKENKNKNQEKKFRNMYNNEINARKEEINKSVQEKINIIKQNKNKHYVIFKKSDNDSNNSS